MFDKSGKAKAMFIVLLGLIFFAALVSCSASQKIDKDEQKTDRINLNGTGFEKLDLPEDYDIREYEGTTLNFIVENNLYANILSHESEEFSDITGININIRAVDFDTLIQKINLDFIAHAGKYQLIYVDPYQTLNRFYNYLEVLNSYSRTPDRPHITGFPEDFIDFQTEVCSYFQKKDKIYTIPFDSTTMILFYRKDIFARYRARMIKELGYDPTPGSQDFTWERYCEVAEWINDKVPEAEVKYGSSIMAQEHNSVFCEFSNLLAAYGGNYFLDKNISTLGTVDFQEINVQDSDFIQALDMYKRVASVSAPEGLNWNWADAAAAFRNGEIAMMANWDENYTYLEDEELSKVAGKVGYAILPYGDAKSCNLYGGSGIGINKYATETEKEAAWLYIVWATSKEMQLKVFQHAEGGSLPTRKSAYEEMNTAGRISEEDTDKEAAVKDLSARDAFLKHKNAVLDAWKPENIYLRPKTSEFYNFEKVMTGRLHQMLKDNLDSREVSNQIYQELMSPQ